MKKQLCILGLLGFMGLQAQTGKVGVNTETPTEILDVNGTVRVRSLPEEGTVGIHTTGTNTSTTNPSQAFTPKGIVVADENGVLGVSPGGLSNSNGATADNNSTAMFVKKKYSTGDWPEGSLPNTGFSTTKWDAILIPTRLSKRQGRQLSVPFMSGANGGNDMAQVWLDVIPSNGTWRVTGDVSDLSEDWEFTILFINKNYIVADENRISL